MEFDKHFQELKSKVDSYVRTFLNGLENSSNELGNFNLLEAITYSAQEGGMRLRPILSLLTAEALGKSPELVLPFGCAVELIHSYSLIHDDLPCMDNDDFRRGKLANHKMFGEGLAVLAGDALITEAFSLLTREYKDKPDLALGLISDLAKAAGARGMVGGQAADLSLRAGGWTRAQLESLHKMKTGALIKVSVMAAAKICGVDEEQSRQLEKYADALGLLYQFADDIGDNNDAEPSIVKLVGLDEAKLISKNLFVRAKQAIETWGSSAQGLRDLVNYVIERTH